MYLFFSVMWRPEEIQGHIWLFEDPQAHLPNCMGPAFGNQPFFPPTPGQYTLLRQGPGSFQNIWGCTLATATSQGGGTSIWACLEWSHMCTPLLPLNLLNNLQKRSNSAWIQKHHRHQGQYMRHLKYAQVYQWLKKSRVTDETIGDKESVTSWQWFLRAPSGQSGGAQKLTPIIKHGFS